MLSDVTFSHFCNDNHEYKIMAPRVDLPLLKKVELIKDYDRQVILRKLSYVLEKFVILGNKLLKGSTISFCALEKHFQVNIQTLYERICKSPNNEHLLKLSTFCRSRWC